ncbi:DUF6586 family protein [Candidatus Sororendozoicomonas aggregata]|uniref:DUF6586 family protein n=1 Tax=Candidatus Sororendozoicomonas aggregata TaxID=3073239 RepID=UPI002ED0DB2B
MDDWRRFTNKMLFHARTHLQLWQQHEDTMACVFRDACLHSMSKAYQSLLAEILVVYQVRVSHLPDLNEASLLLQKKQKISSELTYLQELEQKQGWLSDLQRAYHESLLPAFGESGAGINRGGLSLKIVDESLLTTVVDMKRVYEALVEFVTYSRNYSLEW